MKVRDLRRVLKEVGRLHEQRGDKAVRKGLDAFAILLDGHDDKSVCDYMETVRRVRKGRKVVASAASLRPNHEK
jgi:hypothetical protein